MYEGNNDLSSQSISRLRQIQTKKTLSVSMAKERECLKSLTTKLSILSIHQVNLSFQKNR